MTVTCFFRKGIGTAEPVNLWVYTVLNNAISPNFVVWEFYGSAQLPKSFVRFARNSAESVFPQNFHARKLGESLVLYAMIGKKLLPIFTRSSVLYIWQVLEYTSKPVKALDKICSKLITKIP